MYQKTVSQAQDPSSRISSYKALSSDTILGVNNIFSMDILNFHWKLKIVTVKKLP